MMTKRNASEYIIGSIERSVADPRFLKGGGGGGGGGACSPRKV